MPIIHYYLNDSFTAQQRAKLAARITAATAQVLKVPPDHVIVMFHPLDDKNLAVGGVTLAKKKSPKPPKPRAKSRG
jgi:phenylpyruvate tautomerase PptA (4-oxalocrotonate tautomerase family)